MENDKKFTSEMFGYSKKEVEEYIKDMKADYEETMKVSKEVTEDYKAKQPFKIKIKRGLLRVFAPLL